MCVLMGEGLYGWSKLQGTGAGLAYQESQSTVCLVKKAHTLKAIIYLLTITAAFQISSIGFHE